MSQGNVKLTITYDGNAYHGWQRQIGSITTVQQVLEEAIARAVGHAVTVRGAGRTDTGVHAAGQVANFSAESPIPTVRLHRVISKYLPRDVRVIRAEDVDESFDAITSAKSKLYRYTVFNHNELPLTMKNYCYQYYHRCDETLMRQAAEELIGEHDFAGFTSANCARRSTRRRLYRCQVWRKYHRVYFDLEGNGFLYHMVRNIVGTLLEIGRGRWPVERIGEILAAKDRNSAGPMAPACGLSLQWVRY